MVKKQVLCGLLVALALALSYLEMLLPLQLLVPIPGIKLGLANTVTLFALVFLGRHYALAVLVTRCLLQGLLFSGVSAMLFSLSGGLLAFAGMALCLSLYPDRLSEFGLSIAGAALHNIGQILCASVMFQNAAFAAYLPVLLLTSVVSGSLTGYISYLLFPRLEAVTAYRRKSHE